MTFDKYKKLLNKVQRSWEKEDQELYKNGFRMIVRECLRYQTGS